MAANSDSRRLRAFYRLWVGDSLADIGTAAYLFVVPILIVTVFQRPDNELGFVVAILTAAPGLLSLPLGVLADRFYGPLSLHLANLVRLVLTLILIALLITGKLSLFTLVLIAFSIEVLSLFYDLVISALVPRLAPESKLTYVNALIESGDTVTTAGGEMVGSLLYARLGAIGVCVLNAISYVAGSIGAWGMTKYLREENAAPAEETGESAERSRGSFRRELGENIRIWSSQHSLVVLTLNAMLFNVAIGFVMTLLVPYSLETVGISVAALGFCRLRRWPWE